MVSGSNKAKLEAAIRNFNDPDSRPAYLHLYAANAVLYGYGPEPLDGEAIRGFYGTLRSAFPDCRVEIEDVLADREKLAVRFTFSGTHKGEFIGIASTGRLVRMPGITILRFDGGACVERWSQSDFFGMFQQLGQSPGPG